MKPSDLSSRGNITKDQDEPSLELAGLLHALLRFSWAIVIGAVSCGLAAGFFVQRIPELYQSLTVIQIESQPDKTFRVESKDTENDLRDPLVMETVIQNFRNPSLSERVAKELNLANDPEFLGRTDFLPASETEVLSLLSSSARVAARPKTLLVDISFTHRDPKVARRLADTLVHQFLQQNTAQQVDQMESQNALLVQKAAELKTKVEGSELKVQDYKNRMESVSLDSGRNLVEAKLQSLNGSITAARDARIRIESDLSIIHAVADRDPTKLITIASVATEPLVVEARTQVKTLETEISTLADQFRNKHPRMIEARNRLEEAKTEEVVVIRSAPDRVEAQYQGALAAEKALEKAVSDQEKELLKLDEKITPYRRLQQELETDRVLYDSVQKRLKEAMLLMDIKPVNFRIVESATPAVHLPNRKLLTIVGAVVAGALFVAGIIAAAFFFNSSIKTVDDAERWLGLPVLSAIPTSRQDGSQTRKLSILDQPDSPLAESFRSLRTALSLLGPVEQRKVILFTSAVPAEGKTLNAVNTAIAFTQQGLRTLIIDADLRRPAASEFLLEKNRDFSGLAEFMVGAEADVQITSIPKLWIIPAGASAPNPAELLDGDRFASLIEIVKGQFDRVVIDTAPVNVVSDTLHIVAAAQTIVLVVRNGRTPRKVIRRAIEILARAHVHPDGVALNFMPEWSGIAGHYYYSGNSKYGSAETYGKNYQATLGHSQKTDAPVSLVLAKSEATPSGRS